jgi:hypothetical protein
MKKQILTVIGILVWASSMFAQETLKVDITKLSDEELRLYRQLKQQAAKSENVLENLSPEKIDKYAQIGKAFGSAFKECWQTVSTDAEKFAQSSAGKWTMVLISWKIMGTDAINLVRTTIQFSIGIFLFISGTIFFAYAVRRHFLPIPILKSKTKVLFLTIKREYEGMTKPSYNGEELAGWWALYAIFLVICSLITFLH